MTSGSDWRLELTRQAERDLKRLPRSLLPRITQHFDRICADPLAGKSLSAPLRGCYAYRFTFQGIHYRIAYQLLGEKSILQIAMVAPRENFYRELQRRLGG